jgi:sigma-B regulation protein RsbU (phosphoserine phosphatase)
MKPKVPKAAALTTKVETLPAADARDKATAFSMDGVADVANSTAAKVLIEHLFAGGTAEIRGVEYAVGYQLAHGLTGGDIADVYHFDNDAVSFTVADISGKGTKAAIHAALVKYGLRAYASQGLTPERVLRSLDRLYLENNAFEKMDTSRRIMNYASGGHEAAAIIVPGERAHVIEPTAPLIGVFDDQHHLFKHGFLHMPPGTVFVATTDGITEARAPDGSFFGMQGFVEIIEELAEAPAEAIVHAIIDRATKFSRNELRDDIVVVAGRFP